MNWAISFIAAFAVSAILGILLLPFLRRLKCGQQIREEGPKWHKTKNGTPTMGGIMFILSFIICNIILNFNSEIIAAGSTAVLFGVIGFADDYIKVVKKRNLGITALQKFSAQVIVALGFNIYIICAGKVDTEILLPFAGSINLGIFFIPVSTFFMVGMVNGVNLTDGIDGLAGFVSLIIVVFLAIAASVINMPQMSIMTAIAAGGILGFLIYNIHPAKVFMGDTGSLFIGGLLTAVAAVMKYEIFLIIAGIIFIIETLSVIIQVVSFKITGKRVFKMSPIHHHFEMCGLSEVQIVSMFSAVTLIACVICYFAI